MVDWFIFILSLFHIYFSFPLFGFLCGEEKITLPLFLLLLFLFVSCFFFFFFFFPFLLLLFFFFSFFAAFHQTHRGCYSVVSVSLLNFVCVCEISGKNHGNSGDGLLQIEGIFLFCFIIIVIIIVMDFDAGISLSVTEGPSSLSPSIDQDTLWQMNLRSRESIESGHYPVREGEQDCSYYIRTGLCRFGSTCRFNHPPNRKLAIATARMKGEYPERLGQPECQYYLKTGTCKFGATCKFHHPKDKAGIAGRVTLNVLGYPLRANESECAYYMRTGQCKFGSTCKFHHPQPSNMMVSLRGSPVYPPVPSATTPGQLSYPLSRGSFIPGARWQGPSGYTPVIVPQGVVSVPGFAYSGQMGSVSSPEGQQQTAGNNQAYGTSRSNDPATMGSQGVTSPYRQASGPMGYFAMQGENVFPERPGQPECQFYMKTGDCKFGAVCRFHHPRERLIPPPDCLLSPIGLPLRPGEPLCIFYSRYGICKFGPSCKFDHPMTVFTYSISASSTTDAPTVQRLLGSSSGTSALNLSSEGLVEAVSTKPRRLSLSETRKMPSGDNNIDREG